MTDLPQAQTSRRREVVFNCAIDILLFALVLVFPRADNWLHRIIMIAFLGRIGDFSSEGLNRGWKIFSARLPRTRLDLNARRDLVLFSAYRILGHVISFGLILFCITLYLPINSLQNWLQPRAGIFLWSLLLLYIYVPKRMLLWHSDDVL